MSTPLYMCPHPPHIPAVNGARLVNTITLGRTATDAVNTHTHLSCCRRRRTSASASAGTPATAPTSCMHVSTSARVWGAMVRSWVVEGMTPLSVNAWEEEERVGGKGWERVVAWDGRMHHVWSMNMLWYKTHGHGVCTSNISNI